MTDQEINEAVARKLGYVKKGPNALGGAMWKNPDGLITDDIFMDYCHSIAAAWEVVEYLAEPNTGFVFGLDWRGDEGWWCKMQFGHIDPEISIYEDGDTASKAICLAFLKLNETTVPEVKK